MKEARTEVNLEKKKKNPKQKIRKGLIAASCGYAGQSSFSGILYSGDYSKISMKQIIDCHEFKLGALDKSHADLISFESLPCLKEAQALKKIIPKMEKPCWVCFTCKNGKLLSSGETIRDAVKML